MADIHHILKQFWGYDKFRPLQQDIIESVLAGKNTLALLPTGGGKSICYQVPALAMDGICIVISPLIALMKDQKDQLKKRGIKAEAIYSGMSMREIDRIFDNCIYGDTKFLYVSPERIQTPLFKTRFEKMDVSFIAVDEAHCISQWGYDFRPEYLEIELLKEIKPELKFLAVTATATEEVTEDICVKLGYKDRNIYRADFERSNLSLVVRYTEDKPGQLIHILKKTAGTAIVYANSRSEVKNIALQLQRENISADFYHAGLSSSERMRKQQLWMENKIRVIVSTNAFGMGIDKPDVRLVVHHQMPLTPEAYYQEAGRAGRDGEKCFAVILHQPNDDETSLQRVKSKYPPFATVRDYYDRICNFLQIAIGDGAMEQYSFDISKFVENFQTNVIDTLACINILEQEGYLRQNDGLNEPSKVMILLNQQELYRLQVESQSIEKIMGVMLRMYGSLFDQHTTIREEEIARKLNISPEKTQALLTQLHQAQAIEYIQRKNGPQLLFLQPRIKKTDLVFDAAKIKALFENAMTRLEKMLEYIHLTEVCRSVYLRNYFGDHQALPCGICDVCAEQKKKLLGDEVYIFIQNKIIQKLGDSKKDITELMSELKPHRENEVMQCIRWMIDNEELQLKNGKISITELNK